MATLYKIRNWESIYENNRTREMKLMQWLPLPIKLSGSGYSYMMTQKDGPAIFGCFVAMLELAGRCEPRGTLLRGAGIPHSPRTIAAVIRHPEKLVERTLLICTSEMCDWVVAEFIENSQENKQPAEIPQEGAGKVRYSRGQDITGQDITGHNRRGQDIAARGADFARSWDGFVEMRKKIKKPLTERAIDITLSTLEKLAPRDTLKQAAILDQSTQRDWQGVFALKDGSAFSGKSSFGPQPLTPELLEAQMEAIRDL